MVLELPGWIWVQGVCFVLMLYLNRTPVKNTLGRVFGMLRRKRA